MEKVYGFGLGNKINAIALGLVIMMSTGTLMYPHQVHASTINVPADFSTIQGAISAASAGDTILVAAGTYTEQVTIDKSVTLTGAGSSTTTILAPPAPSGLTPDLDGYKSIVTIKGASTIVDFSGFTVSGPGSSGCASIHAGIFIRDGATASIHDNKITTIGDSPFGGCQNSIGIIVGKHLKADFSCCADTVGTATVQNNIVDSYQKGGIVVDHTGSSATITDNTVTGLGPVAFIGQNGIQVSRGATGIVRENIISANFYTGTAGVGPNPGGQNPPGWQFTACGLLLFEAVDVKYSMNKYFDNQHNICVVP